jgi:hypothetical protein
VRDLAVQFDGEPTEELAGELLWALVAEMQAADIDPEAVLRARSRQFRDDHGDAATD